MSVDAMFIRSTAYLIQSSDGSVVILAYRGTEPTNLVNWLTDADVHPDKIAFPFPRDAKAADPAKSSSPPDAEAVPAEWYAVHAGFYRNVRATRFAVIAALERALDRRSVLDDDSGSPMPPMEKPMTTLYLTGHSLGGAMAALMAVMLSVEPEYNNLFAPMFKGACTYGAPMVGSPEFANACAENTFLDRNVVRYVYRKDLVPHLPPSESDAFQHFGREYRYDRAWKESDKPITQTRRSPRAHRGPAGIRGEQVPAAAGHTVPVLTERPRPAALHLRHHPEKQTQRVRRRLPDPGEVTSRRIRPCSQPPSGETSRSTIDYGTVRSRQFDVGS